MSSFVNNVQVFKAICGGHCRGDVRGFRTPGRVPAARGRRR